MRGGSKPRFDRDEIGRLTKAGWSAAKIADQLGCTERTVVRVRAGLGITQPVPPNSSLRISSERLERARLLIEDGVSHIEVRRTLGVNEATLMRHFPGTQWSRAEVTSFTRSLRAFSKQERKWQIPPRQKSKVENQVA